MMKMFKTVYIVILLVLACYIAVEVWRDND
uniref:Uncharacterized protein n=1 Tax=Dulem virus 36 TaxID=3145754 RepID=A0AAU8B0T2_9CAUD